MRGMFSKGGGVKVLVFGVFDKLHPGHEHFLRGARACGDELIVSVARDSMVGELKNKIPHDNETKRMEKVSQVPGVSRVVLGDEKRGDYSAVLREHPSVICVGHDQYRLAADLREKMVAGTIPTVPIVEISSHEPEKYKTSILHPVA